jgi:hypothetical protein
VTADTNAARKPCGIEEGLRQWGEAVLLVVIRRYCHPVRKRQDDSKVMREIVYVPHRIRAGVLRTVLRRPSIAEHSFTLCARMAACSDA